MRASVVATRRRAQARAKITLAKSGHRCERPDFVLGHVPCREEPAVATPNRGTRLRHCCKCSAKWHTIPLAPSLGAASVHKEQAASACEGVDGPLRRTLTHKLRSARPEVPLTWKLTVGRQPVDDAGKIF